MSYIVLEISIGGRFLENCFYYYSQQVLHANESLIPYNLIKREAEKMFKRWPVNQCIKSFNKFI